MRNIRLSSMMVVCACGWLLLCGCIPDGANRCRDGFVFIDGSCWADSDTTYDTETSEVEDTDTGTSTDELPSGLADPCDDDGDCAGKVAAYCAKEPGQEEMPGSCTIADCADGTNVCPTNPLLVCCAFRNLKDYPSMCVPPATYEEYKDLVGC